MKTIAVINQKGGVGKTTTSAALISGLTHRGYKVLGVDLDNQRNLTVATGAKAEQTSYEFLSGNIDPHAAIARTEQGDVIPASSALATAETAYTGPGREYRLKEALQPLTGEYDFCVIDTPPALGVLTLNALTAADYTVVPAMADIFSFQGTVDLTKTIKAAQTYLNKDLKVAGILLTRYNSRQVLDKEILEYMGNAAEQLGTKVFNATIRTAAAIGKSQATQNDIFTYAPKAAVTEDYNEFIDELLEVMK